MSGSFRAGENLIFSTGGGVRAPYVQGTTIHVGAADNHNVNGIRESDSLRRLRLGSTVATGSQSGATARVMTNTPRRAQFCDGVRAHNGFFCRRFSVGGVYRRLSQATRLSADELVEWRGSCQFRQLFADAMKVAGSERGPAINEMPRVVRVMPGLTATEWVGARIYDGSPHTDLLQTPAKSARRPWRLEVDGVAAWSGRHRGGGRFQAWFLTNVGAPMERGSFIRNSIIENGGMGNCVSTVGDRGLEIDRLMCVPMLNSNETNHNPKMTLRGSQARVTRSLAVTISGASQATNNQVGRTNQISNFPNFVMTPTASLSELLHILTPRTWDARTGIGPINRAGVFLRNQVPSPTTRVPPPPPTTTLQPPPPSTTLQPAPPSTTLQSPPPTSEPQCGENPAVTMQCASSCPSRNGRPLWTCLSNCRNSCRAKCGLCGHWRERSACRHQCQVSVTSPTEAPVTEEPNTASPTPTCGESPALTMQCALGCPTTGPSSWPCRAACRDSCRATCATDCAHWQQRSVCRHQCRVSIESPTEAPGPSMPELPQVPCGEPPMDTFTCASKCPTSGPNVWPCVSSCRDGCRAQCTTQCNGWRDQATCRQQCQLSANLGRSQEQVARASVTTPGSAANIGLIVGATLGGLALVAVVIAVVMVARRRRHGNGNPWVEGETASPTEVLLPPGSPRSYDDNTSQ